MRNPSVLRHPRRLGRAATLVAILGGGVLSIGPAPLYGQDRADRHDEAGGVVLVLPTGDRATGNLLVELVGPAEVAVGKSYPYNIRLTNISRNLVLEDVKVHQSHEEGFSIEQSEPKPDDPKDSGSSTWSLSKLEPGQSRIIKVGAMADREGIKAGCVRVDYRPALCIATRFVKPEIQVTKSAPKQVDICRPLEFRYRVANTGSGPARGVKVKDELPKGLAADGGQRTLAFDVGDLAPGQEREYQARIQASEPGEYASRAVAEGAGDLEARSNKTTTRVVRAKLAVSIDGPEAVYIGRPSTYQVRVDNQGDAPAMDAHLQVQPDQDARVIRMSKADPGGAAPAQDGRAMTWELGTIEPGGHRVVSFTTATRAGADLTHRATATSACDRGGDLARSATVTRSIQTAVITLPALRLEMVDQVDPVRVGDDELYTITVRNQGSGADKDVKITCRLPEQFKFVGVDGTTDAKADGQKITLGPIDRLGPNEKASWTLRVKAEKPGDVRNEIELDSDYLSQPVPEYEPTRILASGTTAAGGGSAGRRSGGQ